MESHMNFIKKYSLAICLVFIVAIAGIFYLVMNRKPAMVIEKPGTIIFSADDDENKQTPAADEKIKVYVTGAVKNPGVYEISKDMRVDDAIRLAGGPSDEADMMRINLAGFLTDGMQITVPAAGEEIYSGDSAAGITSDGKVNINTASESQLTTLPGIGAVIAGNIIKYREDNGPFKSTEEIKNVNRIGEATFNNIKDMITVGE